MMDIPTCILMSLLIMMVADGKYYLFCLYAIF